MVLVELHLPLDGDCGGSGPKSCDSGSETDWVFVLSQLGTLYMEGLCFSCWPDQFKATAARGCHRDPGVAESLELQGCSGQSYLLMNWPPITSVPTPLGPRAPLSGKTSVSPQPLPQVSLTIRNLGIFWKEKFSGS